jgi:hypothetical protein
MDITWRRSSFSSSNGGACVEVGVWRKSTYSSSNGGNCVEVGTAAQAAIAVRDTKDHGHGLVLRFTPAAWAAFTSTLR